MSNYFTIFSNRYRRYIGVQFFRNCITVLFIALMLTALPGVILAQKSTTGPIPPPNIQRGFLFSTSTQNVIPNIPSYIHHHGCGPTALGMVIGYWDGNGFPLLIPGDAFSQTTEVNAMIANDSGSPECVDNIIELGHDDGTCDRTISWINHDDTTVPYILYNIDQSQWGYNAWAGGDYISNPVDNNVRGFAVSFSASHDLYLTTISIYFNHPLSLGQGFYLNFWDANNNLVLPDGVFISSDEVVGSGWWEKDISYLNIIIESGEEVKAGICQYYLPYFELPPNIPVPERPVFLGVDDNTTGHSWNVLNGNFYPENTWNTMIRVTGINASGDHYQDYSCPLDPYPNPILSDKSELGGAHESDCVADFMKNILELIKP